MELAAGVGGLEFPGSEKCVGGDLRKGECLAQDVLSEETRIEPVNLFRSGTRRGE
jgi:hypothetical protein